MNVHVFTTGRGTPYGLAMAPVIKVASRTALAEVLVILIDIDAGTIATGAASAEEVGSQIFEFILEVASGRKTGVRGPAESAQRSCTLQPGPDYVAPGT